MSALDIEVVVVGLLYGACVESLPILPRDLREPALQIAVVYDMLVMFLPETWEPRRLDDRRRNMRRAPAWKA